MTTAGTVAIVGAGEAGVAAAVGLRRGGWEGKVLLIGTEEHAPYERPPLSKDNADLGHILRLTEIGDGKQFNQLDISHLRGVSVVNIDRRVKSVTLSTGKSVTYDKLLLATGARARQLTIEGGSIAHLLRTFSDAVTLLPKLQAGCRVLIVGGGFIGLELAATARCRGAAVTVLETASRVLARSVPETLSRRLVDRHRRAGVKIVTNVELLRIERSGFGFVAHLSDSSSLETDCVVAGIGAVPNVELAEKAGLKIENGIAVDERLATTDSDIFAAGDCCSFPHPVYGGCRIRLEAWRNARDQGAAVARSILGQIEAYAAVPWFWSDQYDLHLQIAGLSQGASTVVSRDIDDDASLVFHLASDGRILAASGLGPIGKIAKDIRIAEMMISKQTRPDPTSLASPNVSLKSLLRVREG